MKAGSFRTGLIAIQGIWIFIPENFKNYGIRSGFSIRQRLQKRSGKCWTIFSRTWFMSIISISSWHRPFSTRSVNMRNRPAERFRSYTRRMIHSSSVQTIWCRDRPASCARNAWDRSSGTARNTSVSTIPAWRASWEAWKRRSISITMRIGCSIRWSARAISWKRFWRRIRIWTGRRWRCITFCRSRSYVQSKKKIMFCILADFQKKKELKRYWKPVKN